MCVFGHAYKDTDTIEVVGSCKLSLVMVLRGALEGKSLGKPTESTQIMG